MSNLMPAPRRALRLSSALCLLLPSVLYAQRQGGTLEGRVLAGDVAVPSATIIAGRGRVVLTRVDGRYRLAIPAGRYVVSAQRVGYTTVRDSVTIVAGGTATLNFKIERSAVMLEAVSAVGSRGQVRSVIDAPVPIDVINATDLRATGRTETTKMLQALEPGLTAPRASVAEGSDLIHPFSMRGLASDQVLVLVNGRRRHTSALMNVNGSVGRGSTGVDLDAIPASLIDHVEVLRDGATAQYGSGAVAGVVNIVLKSGVHGDATSTTGRHATTYNRDGDGALYAGGEQSASDGNAVQASIDKGVVFGERGFLHGGFELRDKGSTNRANPGAIPAPAGTVNVRSGDAQSHDVALFFNGGNLFANGLEVYGNAGGSRRTMSATGDLSVTPPLATNPSQPYRRIIRPTIDDYAGTVGVRGALDDWEWDLSAVYGRNTVAYTLENPETRYDAGSVRQGQSTTNLELSRALSYFDETRVTVGAELRTESYAIGAGSSPTPLDGFFGSAQRADQSRHSLGGYLDLESDLSRVIMFGLAGRAEHYSDVGTVGAGKVSLRWEPVRKHALRVSIERGFRAPSLAQSYFSNVSSPTAGSASNVITVAAAGAPALGTERTMTYSAGFAGEPARAVSLAVDLYRIDVKDRIVLRDVPSAIAYSVNGVDTRTSGVNVTGGYALRSDGAGILRLTAGLDVNRTTLTRNSVNGTPALDAFSETRFERGQPGSTLLASAAYQRHAFGALLRTQRVGSIAIGNVDGSAVVEHAYGARWITDANASYTLVRKYTFTVGADNLLDVYPERNTPPPFTRFEGALPYNAASPFGFNGRFVYGRLSVYL